MSDTKYLHRTIHCGLRRESAELGVSSLWTLCPAYISQYGRLLGVWRHISRPYRVVAGPARRCVLQEEISGVYHFMPANFDFGLRGGHVYIVLGPAEVLHGPGVGPYGLLAFLAQSRRGITRIFSIFREKGIGTHQL